MLRTLYTVFLIFYSRYFLISIMNSSTGELFGSTFWYFQRHGIVFSFLCWLLISNLIPLLSDNEVYVILFELVETCLMVSYVVTFVNLCLKATMSLPIVDWSTQKYSIRLSLSVVSFKSFTSLLNFLSVETTNSRGRWSKSYFTLADLSIFPTISALWFQNYVIRCIQLVLSGRMVLSTW